MTDYLRLAQERAPQEPDTQENPYLPLARQQQDFQQNRARTVIEGALKDDPDLAAERLRLSKSAGLPPDVVQRNMEELRAKERARAIDLVKLAEESPVLYRQLTDPSFTTTSVDDMDTLRNLERSIGRGVAYVMGADSKGGLPKDLVGAGVDLALSATAGVGEMAFNLAGTLNDLLGWRSGARAARTQANRSREARNALGFQPESLTGEGVKAGLQSAGTNLAILPIGLSRGLFTTANQAAAAVAGTMSAGVGADAFLRAREEGRTQVQSLQYAIPEATFEFVFERIPASKLFGDIANNTGLLRTLGKQFVSEGWTEQLTTVAQDFNEWMNLNQDKTLAEFIQERPEAAYQTFIATLVGVGVQTSTIQGINSVLERASNQALVFEQDMLAQQLQLAAASTLRTRSPEMFRAHIQRIQDENEGAPKEVYVDAQVLNQLPPELLEQLPESVREALPDALDSNSTVAIAMADVLTVAPGTPLEQILNDNARMRPNAPSRVEAEMAAQMIEEDAQRVLAQAADTAAWQQSTMGVQQAILDQLNTAGRFTPEVNEAYATLQANFFSTMAARVGVTPQELYDRYSLRVNAQQPGGAVLNKGTRLGEVTVEGFHFSNAARPVVSTAAFGTGLRGSNRDLYLNAEDQRLRRRAYFYVDKGTGITPEAGVGGIAQKATLSNVYDADADPLRLKRRGGQLAFESAVLDAGFAGYLTRMEGTQSGQVIMLGDQTIPTEAIGPATRLQGRRVPPPQPRPSEGRDVVADALQARRDLPAGSPTRADWSRVLQAVMPDAHAALQAAGVFDGNPSDALYKSDLIKEFENRTDAPVYEQSGRQGGDTSFADRARELLDSKPTPALSSVDIVDGKVDAPSFANITELAAHFTKKNRGKAKDLSDPKVQARIADALYAEALHGLTDAGNAIGWYDRKTRAALDIITEVHPELATDEQSRFAFIALLAVTSNGLRSRDNFVIAEQLYREGWKVDGRFPEQVPQGGPRAVAMGETFALLNRKVDELGWQAVRDFMSAKHTAKEVRDFAGANSFFGEQATSQVPGALFLGPKLGSFFNNLYGDFSTVTMDRWFMRTMNRVRGRMLSLPGSFGNNLGVLRQQIESGVDTFGVKADRILADIDTYQAMTPEQQGDVLYVRGKLKALQKYVKARHRDYAKPKDDGTGKKRSFLDRTPENYLAKNLDLAMSGSNDAPFSATDRTWIRGVMDQVQDRLKADGVEITNADLQAVLWYYEKDLYERLIPRGQQDVETETQEPKEAEDYETAARYTVGRLQREGLVAGPAGSVRSGDRADGDTGGSLAPLQGAPAVRGASGPDPRLVAVAEQYARDNGIALRRQGEYVQVDPERAARIAQAYQEMQHAPSDPQVKAAYEDLIRQTRAQYDALVDAGYAFTFFDDTTDPYEGNPWNAMRDLRANQRMAVYGTYAGFGVGADLNIGLADPAGGPNLDPQTVLDAIRAAGGEVVGSVVHTSATEPTLVVKLKTKLDGEAAYGLSEALGQEAIAQSFEDGTGQLYGPQAEKWGEYNPDFFVTADGRRASEVLNPLLADTGLQWPDQNGVMRPVKANDLFRAVHDAFGHGLEGAGFRAQGEENAWQAHVRLFTGPAVAAITSETRGQNSWLNYGPYGEQNRNAAVEDTVFAEQKTGLMPEWTWTEGRAGDMPAASSGTLAQSPVGQQAFETDYTDAQGERYDITLRQEVMGMGADRALTVLVEARTADGNRRALVNFAVQGNTLAAENAMVAPAYRRRGLAEVLYRAAREAGYNIAPGRKQTAMGEGMVASLRRKGVINAERPSGALTQGPRGTFSPEQLLITLNENADLSTFLHESGHFFLEVLADLASQPNTPQQIKDDMAATLKWFGVPDLATWNDYTLDQKRKHHERWAESFEQYLFEGKSPSAELQPLFRRFRSWLVNVYKSLTQFMRGRNLNMNDEVRQVFDRLIATDEQIRQAEEAAGMLPDFNATNEAVEALQARSLRDLKWTVKARGKALKALEKEAAALRKEVEAEVRAEVEQQPIYRALNWLRKGETRDPETGDLVKAEKGFRLSTTALTEMYPEGMLGRPDLTRLKGMTAKEGLHPDMVADMFGFESGDALVRNILDTEPLASVVEGITDRRMLERHGDLATPEAREAAANEAVHNEARARSLATELKSQAEMMNQRQDSGRTASNGRPITVNAVVEAAKQFALNLAARRRLKDLKNAAWQHRAAEARAGKTWQKLTAEGKSEEAVRAKRDQLLNNYAAKALQDAQVEMRKTLEFFKRVIKGNNEDVVKAGRDPDVVNAMRAILAAYDVAPRGEQNALAYMELVAKNDPAMYAALKPGVDGALMNAKPLPELTLEELRGLNDELRAMWHLAKRSRQMEVDGNLLDIEDAAESLMDRMAQIGIPDRIPGEGGAITDKEERGIKLRFALSILTRVEQWAERMDGRFGGPFLRLVFQPVKDAADRYRTDRVSYRKAYTELLQNVAPFLRPGAVDAPELGYTFGNARDSGQAEILHAILHTGNDSNKRKLLLGRGWATQTEDGALDTSRWDSFVQRMVDEGKITKAHYDFAQGVWDLLEQMKPLAQETHRKVFGRYFAEVTANSFETPFGSYRGGYVPAQTDSRIVKDAKLRELAETENESLAYAFPAAPSGFTKARVDYNKPLLLDLRTLAQHMDKVLLFSHMQGAVTDVRRLLTNKRVSYALDRIDPGAYEGMLIPWLNRAAKQVVETPVAGDRKLSRFLSASRSRAGMALMFANLSNTVQQITGFPLAAVKVKPNLMMKATAQFIAGPKAMKAAVAEASPFMKDRMINEVAALTDATESILVNPSLLEKSQAWTNRHAYFMQAGIDNVMSPIIWTAAYNQAIQEGQNERDAVRFADGVIRQTQSTTLPEDISRFESGPAASRIFTQFVSYFNMMANTNATAMSQIVGELGLRRGAGKLLYVALVGMMLPIWIAETIAHAFRGGPEDEDDDGYLDDWLMAVFGMGTLRGLVAQVPIAGQAAQLVVNRFNDNPADDKFSLSPAVSLIESAVSAPASVYKAIVDEGSAQKAVRDTAAAATMITGLPFFAAARPAGYLAGVADGRIEPTGPVDLARGLATGTASPESKSP